MRIGTGEDRRHGDKETRRHGEGVITNSPSPCLPVSVSPCLIPPACVTDTTDACDSFCRILCCALRCANAYGWGRRAWLFLLALSSPAMYSHRVGPIRM